MNGMNGMMTGQNNPFANMSQEQIAKLMQMIQLRKQQQAMQNPQMNPLQQQLQQRNPFQPMMTGQMMAQNDGVSNQTRAGFLQNGLDRQGGYGQQPPAPAPVPQSVGGTTPDWEIQLRLRQQAETRKNLGLPPNATEEQVRNATIRMMEQQRMRGNR